MSTERERLLADAAVGRLDAAGWREVNALCATDATARAELARHLAVHGWLHAAGSTTHLDVDLVMRALPIEGHVATRVMRRVRAGERGHRFPRARQWTVVAFAAAAVIAVAVLWPTSAPVDNRAADALAIVGKNGNVGGELRLGAGGKLDLVAGDGARFALEGPAIAHIEQSGGNTGLRIRLDAGLLAVSAPKRQPGRDLVIITPSAVMTVVGTAFQVRVEAAHTWLDVTEGIVRFAPQGQAERLVNAGESAEASVARTVSIPASEDATATQAQPSDSQGTLPLLEVRASAPARLACLRFQLPPGRVDRAMLRLTRIRGSGAIAVYRAAGPWDEATLRWYHAPTLGDRIAIRKGEDTVDVTAACSNGVCDLVLIGLDQADCAFASRESTDGRPQLDLVITPP